MCPICAPDLTGSTDCDIIPLSPAVDALQDGVSGDRLTTDRNSELVSRLMGEGVRYALTPLFCPGSVSNAIVV